MEVSWICCKLEVELLYTMGEIDLLILNFRPTNLLRFVILQKNRHTADYQELSTDFETEKPY